MESASLPLVYENLCYVFDDAGDSAVVSRKTNYAKHPRIGHHANWPPLRNRNAKDCIPGVQFLIGAAALLSLAGCANQSAISLEGKPRSGYVRMTQVQAAYIGSGDAGSGVYYQGGRYPFSVGGLGISKIEAKGDVYGLQHLGDFAGAYAQGRYGFCLPAKHGPHLMPRKRPSRHTACL